MNDIILLSMTCVSLVLALLIGFVLSRVWREQKKLKQQLHALAAQLQRQSDDVAGLCSAAVGVDRRLAFNDERLQTLSEQLARSSVMRPVHPEPETMPTDFELDEGGPEPAQGYQLAIEKIRRGASVDDLVKTCHLTRDEAMLLMRLHGKKQG